ncbi:MAG: acetyl-CoA carboxylase biotin carboxyl carrier protein subunit [Actinobacteria bacterium]|nr:acetyl-CoA carboxylase biotin carboxyl carrier protein subunit [Actinomycetota bacterium]MBO0785776.1 acetyl-CoA carboxylase biotin carboxyl carrier protein subunit [Actinomycetota bacterium]
MTAEDVQDILRLLDTLPFTEFELETSRFTLSLRRAGNGVWERETQVHGEPRRDPAGQNPLPQAPAPAAPEPARPGEHLILAPLPGTFYRAPQPGAPPFVEPGSQVSRDTVVAIIETMKLMNPVYPPAAGTISEVCVRNGEFAAAGAVLMRMAADPGGPAAAAGEAG